MCGKIVYKRDILCFCAHIRVSKEWRNEQKISAVIHALLFAWYLIRNFLTSLKHLGLVDVPITIGTCLSLPSLLTHSSTVSLVWNGSLESRLKNGRQRNSHPRLKYLLVEELIRAEDWTRMSCCADRNLKVGWLTLAAFLASLLQNFIFSRGSIL
jgi:hypothetical protein